MTILGFTIALVWGTVAAQFLLQAITSLCIVIIYLPAIAFSKVRKALTVRGVVTTLCRTILFLALFLGGYWLSRKYINYANWNLDSITTATLFAASALFMFPQIPGKISFARKCAWQPNFLEASRDVSGNEHKNVT